MEIAKNVKFFYLKTNFEKFEFKHLLDIKLFDFIFYYIKKDLNNNILFHTYFYI